MEPYASYTKSISESAGGKTTGAFFDFDGTVIATHSIKEIFIERLKSGEVTAQEVYDVLSMIPRYLLKSDSFEDTMAASIENLRGMPEKKLVDVGEKVSREQLAAEVFPEVRAMIQAHQKKGHTVAIVSSATRYQIEPVARILGIDEILCTQLDVKDGKFTGKLLGENCYGENKAAAVRKFAKTRRVSLKKSYFYSNGAEDIALLRGVGHPVVINPDSKLEAAAKKNGWLHHQLESRGTVGVGDVARTLLTFGSALPFLAASLPIRALGATQREATNFSVSAWTNLAAVVARLKLIVEGEENLWSHRPAVFLFNHQSAMDVIITAKLLREDAVGVAKKEIQRQPFMGPALTFAGAVFLDRENIRDPQAALQPAIDALGEGKCVVIAPEGTRSKDGKLGDFKRGAFHMARQAGVPIVPIVIHNAHDALPGNSMVVRPAEVKVTVLKPVSTEGWKLRDVAPQSRRIRDLYLDTLGQAHGGDAAG